MTTVAHSTPIVLRTITAKSFDEQIAAYAGHRRGFCVRCSRRYLWPAHTGKLRDARCPTCTRRLTPTTWYAKSIWLVMDRRP